MPRISVALAMAVIQTPKSSIAAMGKSGKIVRRILAAHNTLAQLPSLEPGSVVDSVLTDLVHLCIEIHDAKVVELILKDARLKAILPDLRRICAEAEARLEDHWATLIYDADLDAAGSLARLREFPYYPNYQKLVRLELAALSSVMSTPPTRIAYIGSGPMPLTSLTLLDIFRSNTSPWPAASSTAATTATAAGEVKVLNIDREEGAIWKSRRLTLRLGEFGNGMSFSHVEASDTTVDLTTMDVVYLASLVGASQAEKEKIIASVAKRMRPGAVFVTRSAWGLRKCLYPEIDLTTKKLRPLLETCVVVHPYREVVNSVIIARVKGQPELATS